MCEIRGQIDYCNYTIVCDTHSGNARNPECDVEPNVTFIITKSIMDTLTFFFFGATNFDSRVRIIKGIDNSWTNIESYSFKYYPKLLTLDLSFNKIKNVKNEAFRNLIALKSLNLSGNAIEMLNTKSFMISDSRNSNLEVLDLSNNLLTELVGDIFSFIPKLKTMYLQNNKLMTLTEDCFNDVKILNSLILHHNQLPSLNMTLVNLKMLKELDVSFNYLTKVSGYEINRLVALVNINMSYNSIQFIESNSFNQAFNLQSVDLRYNRVQSSIENVMFINNNKLDYLNVYQNNITRIQDNAFKHNILNYLNLENNNISGEITANTFTGLQNVTTLNLSNQSITAIRNDGFSDAVHLVYLNLSKNYINLIGNSSFAKANALKILDVSYNNVSNLYFLQQHLQNLTELYLQSNNLIDIPTNAFETQKFLIRLDISNNKILNIQENSLPLLKLQYLNIDNNKLTGVLAPKVFTPSKYIRYLDLSNFRLTKIDKMALVDTPVLARLNISHNNLEYIDASNFKGMDNMYSLDISYNKLSRLQLNNSFLGNLKALYLNNNKLSNISETLLNMKSLLYLDLSNNQISNLGDIDFSLLPNLQVLHLSHNNIKDFNIQTDSLQKLTDLNLSSNQMTEINLVNFKDLIICDVSNNNISSINSTFFENLDYLQSLDISKNNIAEILPGTFQKVKILKLLNISGNHISKLRYGIFKGLHRMEVLDLSYNKISDIDVDVFHECVELRRLTIDYNYVKTLDVERLTVILPKLSTLSLGGNPISCKEIVRNIKKINKNILVRQVDVTSIDKIYHEDNVHGIRCGDINQTVSTEKPKQNITPEDHSISVVFGVAIWCSVITILVVVIAVSVFLYRRKQVMQFNRESRLQLRSSLDYPSSDQGNDLLGEI